MTARRHPWLRRVFTPPLMLAAAALVLFEELAWDALQRLAGWLARRPPLCWVEPWVRGLGPWGTLALFLIPAAGLVPVKLAAVWLIGSGHPLGGLAVLLAAKVIGTATAAHLYAIGKDKLLSIGWFAWAHGKALALQALVHGWLNRRPLWVWAVATVRRLARRLRALRGGWLTRRWRAARRWVREPRSGGGMPPR